MTRGRANAATPRVKAAPRDDDRFGGRCGFARRAMVLARRRARRRPQSNRPTRSATKAPAWRPPKLEPPSRAAKAAVAADAAAGATESARPAKASRSAARRPSRSTASRADPDVRSLRQRPRWRRRARTDASPRRADDGRRQLIAKHAGNAARARVRPVACAGTGAIRAGDRARDGQPHARTDRGERRPDGVLCVAARLARRCRRIGGTAMGELRRGEDRGCAGGDGRRPPNRSASRATSRRQPRSTRVRSCWSRPRRTCRRSSCRSRRHRAKRRASNPRPR